MMAITAGQSSNTWLKNIEQGVLQKMCRNLLQRHICIICCSTRPWSFSDPQLILVKSERCVTWTFTWCLPYIAQNNRGDFTNILLSKHLYILLGKNEWYTWTTNGSKLSNPEMSSWMKKKKASYSKHGSSGAKRERFDWIDVGHVAKNASHVSPGSAPQKTDMTMENQPFEDVSPII